MPDGQIRLKGAVEPGVVADMLQFLSGRPDRVGFLRVFNRKLDGRIWYKDGTVVAAECGAERDLDAIRHILRMKAGEFSFVDTNLVPQRSIFDDTTSILLECFRQIDESKEGEPDESEPHMPLAPDTPHLDAPAGWPMQQPAPGRPSGPSTPVYHPPRPPVYTPRAPTPQTAEPAEPIHRPAAPWAEQGAGTSTPPALSTAHRLSATAPAASGPELPPTDGSAAAPPAALPAPKPRVTFATSYGPPPGAKRTVRPERMLLAVACVVVLGVSGVLLWRVLESRNRRAAATTEDPSGEPVAAPPETSRRVAWLSSILASATSAPQAPAAPVSWPAVRLSGIVAVPGRIGSAVINGRMVVEGQTFDGIVLDMVTRTGVVLRCGEATRFVSDSSIGNPNEPSASTNAPVAITNAPPPTGFRGFLQRWFGK